MLLIHADGATFGSDEGWDAACGETVGGFRVGMAVTVVLPGADEGERW